MRAIILTAAPLLSVLSTSSAYELICFTDVSGSCIESPGTGDPSGCTEETRDAPESPTGAQCLMQNAEASDDCAPFALWNIDVHVTSGIGTAHGFQTCNASEVAGCTTGGTCTDSGRSAGGPGKCGFNVESGTIDGYTHCKDPADPTWFIMTVGHGTPLQTFTVELYEFAGTLYPMGNELP